MKVRNRFTALGALVISGALALSACAGDNGGSGGGGGGGGESTPGSNSSEETPQITWMAMLHTATTPPKGGVVEQRLNEITGAEITFQWVPDASREERINAALSGGSLTDIVALTNITNTTVRGALASGMFWDVEPYLSEFENLSQIPEGTLESAKLGGSLYGVPFQKPIARYGVHVRQDWLDNLGLEVPHTIEELTEVARAFTEDDPDGNGVDDTVGFYDRAESFLVGFRSLSGYFGAGNRFEVTENDEIVPAFATEPFFEAMKWYREVYENGWVNQEFVTVQKQNQTDGIVQNKGGIVVSGLFEARGYHETALSADPNTPMEWAQINDITYKDVPRRILSDTNGGMGGWLAIPKTVVETEDDLRTVLGVIDSLLTPEAYEVMTHGIEGVHFERDAEGVVTKTDNTKWEQEVQPYSSSRPSELVTVDVTANPYVNIANELMAENGDYVVINPAQPLSSETYDEQWSIIEQEVNDGFNKYIMGQIEFEDYEAVIEGTRSRGLDKIIEEFTGSYAEAQANS